ncbi:D-aminoacyl-tRNA deacylase [Vagococcus acidifermentans]|uniref:D-aminoacyl-tRNA deacylase n=1 Tax=Vagococcus acidifermentans TaxID=564710 RepID=A0A430AT10_9ENTE|nr:D-aminoacyl-tRNA deacylase [Vagococcus acidifermentans]RSU11198.1 D-tyrosyl-tRNA(Tyr) deacylase [Vagococcus acidifermentans]
MRIVLQRVSHASVTVAGQTISNINQGFMLLVGVKTGDTKDDADYLAKKVSKLRVFEDAQGKMNLSIHDVGGEILSVSQFTLLADTRKGNRPSFIKAAQPDEATALYEYFNEQLRSEGLTVATGAFGEHMQVALENDGPVTIIFDTENK